MQLPHNIVDNHISSSKQQFQYYKSLADKSINSLSDEEFFGVNYAHLSSNETNSVAVIVKHIAGNMKSRWTDPFHTDGEKEWRHRELEFRDEDWSREQIITYWDEAWKILFDFIDSLNVENFSQLLYIRNMGHTVIEAMNRQMMHYAYHIGQIVIVAKIYKGEDWKSLSIPKGKSRTYNAEKFSKEKSKKHFTEDL